MFSDYGCSEDESRKKRSVSEDDLGTEMPCPLRIYKSEKVFDAIYFISSKRQIPNKPFTTTGNKAKKQRGKDCFAVLPPITGNNCLILF